MATTTTHYGFTKPGVNDYVDISVLNANFDNLDTVIYNNQLSAQAALDDIAPEYDATATYSVGDYVTYNKTLYRCITAIATAEAFDDTKWTAVKVGGELRSHDARISDLEAGVELEGAATNSFDDGIDSYFKKVVSTIVPVQAGSGTPSPTNVRAISGFTECTVNDWGVNRFELQFTSQTINGVTFTVENGVIKTQGTASAEIKVLIGVSHFDYTGASILSGCPANGSQETYRLIACDSGGGEYYAEWGEGREISNTLYVAKVKISIASGVNVSGLEFKPMVIPKTEAGASFEPYKSTTATISFGSAGTVYGGTVDLISGKLVVDKGYKEYNGSEAWTNVGGNYPQTFQFTDTTLQAQQLNMALLASENKANLYPWIAADSANYGIRFQVASSATGKIFVYDNNYSSDLSGFLSHLQNTHLQICYLLDTPQEYQLTPAQLRSLVVVNNLSSSTGEVTEVEYIKNKTIAWLLDLIRT